jgi:hypothetical protein
MSRGGVARPPAPYDPSLRGSPHAPVNEPGPLPSRNQVGIEGAGELTEHPRDGGYPAVPSGISHLLESRRPSRPAQTQCPFGHGSAGRAAPAASPPGTNIMNAPRTTADGLLAGPHNARLGPAIRAFNLPARPDVCAGATPARSSACYAKGFLFRLQLARHTLNLQRSAEGHFARDMAAEIRKASIPVVRIHTSGDFYDAR